MVKKKGDCEIVAWARQGDSGVRGENGENRRGCEIVRDLRREWDSEANKCS